METESLEDLPLLPEPWEWEIGKLDGDPTALRRVGGIVTRVHEYTAIEYTDRLAITVNRENEEVDYGYLNGHHPLRVSFVGDIPVGVFVAVNRAVKQWYEER